MGYSQTIQRRQKLAKHTNRSWIRLLNMTTSIAVFWVLVRYATPANVIWLPLIIPISFLLTVVHELGHLAAGKLAGLRFALFVVGPLQIARGEGGWKISIEPKLPVAGAALSVPTDDANDEEVRHSYLWLTIGGPAANLIVGFLCYALYLAVTDFQPGLTPAAGPLPFFLFVTGLFSAVACILNLVPLKVAGFSTDGRHMIDLLLRGPRAEQQCLLMKLAGAELLEGKRPRDWNSAWIASLTASPEAGVHALKLAYLWALDCGDLDGARSYLSQALDVRDVSPPQLLPGLMVEAAYYEARYGNDPLRARRYLAAARGAGADHHTRLRAQAALALAEGKRHEAQARANLGLASIKKAPSSGRLKAEEEWLQELFKMSVA
jgi:hypothetical protein